MPNFDGTGPMGQGSMTGRGFGWCKTAVKKQQIQARNIQNETCKPHTPHHIDRDMFVRQKNKQG